MNNAKIKAITILLILSINSNQLSDSKSLYNNKEIITKSSNYQLKSPLNTDSIIKKNLNDFISMLNYSVYNRNSSLNGWNVFDLWRYNDTNGDGTVDEYSGSILLVTNMNGDIINSLDTSSRHTSPKFINSTTIMSIAYGNISLWNIETDTEIILPIPGGHHDLEYNPITKSFLVFKNCIRGFYSGDPVRYDDIYEYNMNGDILWHWNSTEFLPFNESMYNGETYAGEVDWIHANTIFWDIEEDMIYYNARNLDTFYKINKKTGQIEWSLGKFGDFELYNKTNQQVENLWYHSHAVEKLNDERFIMFDNDYLNYSNSNPLIGNSRFLEIEINITNMTAKESWSWIAPSEYYCAPWGDADLLPNDNILGSFGFYTHPAYITEVNREGDIVWEITFNEFETYKWGIYKAERFFPKPIVKTDYETINVIEGKRSNFTINTWNSFRTRYFSNATCEIYDNESIVFSNNFQFKPNWEKTTIPISIENLSLGDHNLSIIITNSDGINSTHQICVSVKTFYINRFGPQTIELGQLNSLLMWEGNTTIDLNFSVYVNKTIKKSGKWEGENIEFDLNNLELGNQEIQFLLYNNDFLVYNDTFWVKIYPLEFPLFLSSPVDKISVWNESLTLFFELFDRTPSSWSIYINNILITSKSWNDQHLSIEWNVPFLNEGVYNITFLATDKAQNILSKTIWITIISPSPPIISSFPTNTKIIWGYNTDLVWEIHGGSYWELWKNNSIIFSGIIENIKIILSIDNWNSVDWLPGNYNLTIYIVDQYGNSTYNTLWIEIDFKFGDEYVNSFITKSSLYYSNGEKAVGSPDDEYAVIFLDYSNGYITLDMGLNEEIVDSLGNDFTVYVEEGEYSVWVSNSLSIPFTIVGIGTGNQSFNLSTVGFQEARYVRIEYRRGDHVRLDAVEAIHYNQITIDYEPPNILELEDFWIWENQSTIILHWEVFDLTPWNYTIFLNGIMFENSRWDGSDIIFEYQIESLNNITITLILFDLFGNRAESTVNVEIREIPESTTESVYQFIFVLLSLAVIIGRKRIKNKKE